jgi:hypothetical protein
MRVCLQVEQQVAEKEARAAELDEQTAEASQQLVALQERLEGARKALQEADEAVSDASQRRNIRLAEVEALDQQVAEAQGLLQVGLRWRPVLHYVRCFGLVPRGALKHSHWTATASSSFLKHVRCVALLTGVPCAGLLLTMMSSMLLMYNLHT